MRSSLSTLGMAVVLLVPGAVLIAGTAHAAGAGSTSNASCSNGRGGNGGEYNYAGNVLRAASCGSTVSSPRAPKDIEFNSLSQEEVVLAGPVVPLAGPVVPAR